MNIIKLIRRIFLMFSLSAVLVPVEGQPTSQQSDGLQAITSNTAGISGDQQPDKTRIEQEYLAKARENIEKYRKGDATILFVDEKGKPVKNVQVEINQVFQDFLFGNIAWELTGMVEDQYKIDVFKERFKALFNFAIIPFYW